MDEKNQKKVFNVQLHDFAFSILSILLFFTERCITQCLWYSKNLNIYVYKLALFSQLFFILINFRFARYKFLQSHIAMKNESK